MQITGGRVVYSRTVQPAQYESKKAEVELSFVLAEKEELGDALERVGVLVHKQVLEMVGLAPVGQGTNDDRRRRP
jgi:hypothetical protein